MGDEPGADRLQRHLFERHRAPLDEHLADRRVVVAVLPRVANAQQRAVLVAQAPRALDLEKEEGDRVLDPGELEPPPRERAALDLRAVEIGEEAPPVDPPGDLAPREVALELAEVDEHAIAGNAVERVDEAPGPAAPGGELRLVVAGQEPLVLAAVGRRPGRELALEEGERRGGVAVAHRGGGGAERLERSATERLAERAAAAAGTQRAAGRAEGRERRRRPPGGPAGEIGEPRGSEVEARGRRLGRRRPLRTAHGDRVDAEAATERPRREERERQGERREEERRGAPEARLASCSAVVAAAHSGSRRRARRPWLASRPTLRAPGRDGSCREGCRPGRRRSPGSAAPRSRASRAPGSRRPRGR